MTGRASIPYALSDATQAPDIVACDPHAEIHRCLQILRWLESIPVSSLLRTNSPEINADLISVVVPMYNASRWIDLCLKGLLAQTHSNLEIFCVDDCSDDDTYERVVEQFGKDKRICAIRLSENVGPYQIKNWVIGSLARGNLVALQDADDISHPLRLEEQRRWMASRGYRISGTGAHQFFPPGIKLALGVGQPLEVDEMLHNIAFYPSLEPVTEPTSLQGLLQKRNGADFLESYRTGPYKVYKHTVVDHGSQMMERSLFLEFGGFNTPARMGADTDFNWRLLRFHSMGNVPRILYSRRFHELSLTQHPSTDLASPARQEYRLRRDSRHEQIRLELEAGNITKARELCTADLYCEDVRVQHVNGGFARRD